MIETSTKCSCGAYIQVGQVPIGWDALCPDCYEPVEDARDKALIRGIGETIDDALWDWQEQHDDAHDVTIVLTDLGYEVTDIIRQWRAERERQRGIVWEVPISNGFMRYQARIHSQTLAKEHAGWVKEVP